MSTEAYYILVGVSDSSELFYVSNTLPIVWNSNVSNAKRFDSFDKAKLAVVENFGVLYSTVQNTSMESIFIFCMINGDELRRVKVI